MTNYVCYVFWCKIRLNDISKMFNCWERRWVDVDGAINTLSITTAIFSSVRTISGFSRFRLSMRMTVSFTFLQDNGHTDSPSFLQHYHDFQSDVAIFPSVVQAYTQPYSFGGRIRLIICQIRHELSVTIYEMNTSWKKR